MSDASDSQSLIGTGKVFAEGREALGMSREQLAGVLNLPVRTILAIEENNPSVLPDAVYVNGYMRSYAKLLGLASQPLIDAWWAQHIEQHEHVSIEERNDEIAEKTVNVRPFKMGRWAIAGLLLSVGFVYFVTNSNQQAAKGDADLQVVSEPDALQQEPLSEPPIKPEPEPAQAMVRKTVQEPVQQSETDASIAQILAAQPSPVEPETPDMAGSEAMESKVAEPAPVQTERAETEVVELAVAETEDVIESLTGDLSAADLARVDTAPAGEPEREIPLAFALPRLTEFGDNSIVLSFTADCWFEIRNDDGDLLHADLGRDTQTRRYVGDGPFRIKLGFSPGVSLIYNDEAVDLEPYTRRDVANVIVGAPTGDAEPAKQPQATQAALLW